jgi:hypothetical protein
MNDTDQMLINEARSLERAILARQRKLEALEKQLQQRHARRFRERPKRYSIEFLFENNSISQSNQYPIAQRLPTQQQSFTVDGGTEFFCTEVMSSMRIIGQSQVGDGFPSIPGQVVNVTVPYDIAGGNVSGSASPYFRDFFLRYFWQIRDTQTDRGWQDVEQPSPFMMSGHLSSLYLPVPARTKGGTKLAVELRPFAFDTNGPGAVNLFDSIQSIIVHMSFHGVEVQK